VRATAARRMLLVALVGCAPSPDPRVEKARESLIGVRARDLQECLGPPAESATEGDTETLTFIVIEKERDPLPRRQPQERPELQVPRSRRVNPETGRPQLGTGYCELRFEVTRGRVRAVDVAGRRFDGMANRDCILDYAVCFARLDVK
jgi:hypothetical protein